jgi:transposase
MAEQAGIVDSGLVLGERSDGRRIFSLTAKRALVKACLEPGVSVARVAQMHALNANLLRKWIQLHGREQAVAATVSLQPMLLPVAAIESASVPEPKVILAPVSCIEIVLGGATIRVHGAIDVQQLRLVLDCVART